MLRLCLPVALALLLGLPAVAQAWNWGSLWTVYDGQWPRKQACKMQDGPTGWYEAIVQNTTGCNNSYPVSLLAASASGQVQAAGQIAPYWSQSADSSCLTRVNRENQIANMMAGRDPNDPSYPPDTSSCFSYSIYYSQGQQTRGAQVTVAPGAAVTLEWACMDWVDATADGTCTMSMCNVFGHGDTVNLSYPFYPSSGGSNFSTNGALVGSTTVYPQSSTTYTLLCAGGQAGYSMNGHTYANLIPINGMGFGNSAPLTLRVPDSYLTVTVAVANACPTAIETAPGNSGGWILYNGATRRFNAGGYNKCLTNSSGLNVFIPGRTQAEIDYFMSYHPSGVTVQ